MNNPSSALPPGSRVLVTGANGYLASHVVVKLLLEGYRVRGTARNAAKLDIVREIVEKNGVPGSFESVIVPDMGEEGAFDQAIVGQYAGKCAVKVDVVQLNQLIL